MLHVTNIITSNKERRRRLRRKKKTQTFCQIKVSVYGGLLQTIICRSLNECSGERAFITTQDLKISETRKFYLLRKLKLYIDR